MVAGRRSKTAVAAHNYRWGKETSAFLSGEGCGHISCGQDCLRQCQCQPSPQPVPTDLQFADPYIQRYCVRWRCVTKSCRAVKTREHDEHGRRPD